MALNQDKAFTPEEQLAAAKAFQASRSAIRAPRRRRGGEAFGCHQSMSATAQYDEKV